MRRGLRFVVVAVLLAGCGSSGSGSVTASTHTRTPAPTFIAVTQPFRLHTHCGVLWTYFAGRIFYLEELYPNRVVYLGDPESQGTMTLLSAHVAEFGDRAGHHIRFVDQLPGALGTPYPFAVRVMSGGNTLVDEQFAGRRWHTRETLPGVQGPPFGNGMDRVTEVYGTLTIVDAEDAVFRSDAGAVVHFTALGPIGCD
jgi:hypothetical protein